MTNIYDQLAASLNEKQLRALKLINGIPGQQYEEAHRLGVSASTLAALTRKGLVNRRWRNSSLRGGERWAYRLSNRGAVVLIRIQRAAKEKS